jgi:8-oxo-dGTP pyrophosphatase MutT (NUDIX family)
MALEPGFMRHVRACNTASLPGDRLAFRLAGTQVGWVRREMAAALTDFPGVQAGPSGVDLTDPRALPGIAQVLAERGMFRWRREAFDVRAPDGTVLSTIDRGAIPAFGIEATGVHINGLVHRLDGLHLWIARRAANKILDPGKLDNIVAGGVPAGLSPMECLIKEAAEEAAIPEGLAATARHVGEIRYAMDRPEGLRRDHLHCYDLGLPEDFVPLAADGEVESFELWSVERVFEAVRDTDNFKFNVNLVLIDLFRRWGRSHPKYSAPAPANSPG